MSESPSAVAVIEWLRRQRRLNELQMELMSQRFDFDGAITGCQPEMAWWAMLRTVAAAARLYLYERGVSCSEGLDWTANTRALMDQLAGLDAAFAEELWRRLLQPAPPTMEGVVREAAEAIALVNERLRAKPLNRDASVRGWADSVRLLREVAVGLQIAGADRWYINANDTDAGLSWYDDVMAQLTARG